MKRVNHSDKVAAQLIWWNMRATMCLRQGGDAKRKPIGPGAFLRMKSVCLFISCTFSSCWGSPLGIYYSYVCFFCCLQLSSDEYVARMLGSVFIPSLSRFLLRKASPCGCARWIQERRLKERKIHTLHNARSTLLSNKFILARLLSMCYHNAQINTICVLFGWCTRSGVQWLKIICENISN